MGDLLVMCYHTIAEADHPMAVSAERFHWQITKLLRGGYVAMTVSEALRRRHSGRVIAITFDDGFRSVRDVAFPALQDLGAPATFFPATRFLANRTPLFWPAINQHGALPHRELLPLTPEQVKELVDAGWELGSHSRTHPHLSRLPDDELRNELEQSRDECRQLTATSCDAVAYPFGDFDRRVADAARAAGYRHGLTLAWTTATAEDMAVPRVAVYNGDGKLRFRTKTSRALQHWPGCDVTRGIQRARERRWRDDARKNVADRESSLTTAAEAP